MSLDKKIRDKENQNTICEMKVYLKLGGRRIDDYRRTLCLIWKCSECKDYYQGSKCEHYNPIKNAIPLQ